MFLSNMLNGTKVNYIIKYKNIYLPQDIYYQKND